MSYNHGTRTVYGLNCKKIGNPYVRYGTSVRRLDCGLHYTNEQPTVWITDNQRLAKSMATKKNANLVEYVLVPKKEFDAMNKADTPITDELDLALEEGNRSSWNP